MTPLGQIRGYANTFNTLSAPIGGDDEEPFRAIIRPGAFQLLGVISATVMHGQHQIATTWNKSLRLWQDNHGLAIELDIPCTPDGAGLRNMVAGAGGVNAMSIGLEILKSAIFHDEAGQPCHDISRVEIDHVTICDAGAFEDACCWVAGMPADRMSPRIRNASLRWRLGVIARDQKRAEDRAMVARWNAAKWPP
jgi:HK97 family phage prohead protease